jgi:hypothetical protein
VAVVAAVVATVVAAVVAAAAAAAEVAVVVVVTVVVVVAAAVVVVVIIIFKLIFETVSSISFKMTPRGFIFNHHHTGMHKIKICIPVRRVTRVLSERADFNSR